MSLFVLFLVEVGLRVFNYGHNTSLFIKDPLDDRFMVMNTYASEKYFSDTLNATKGNQELFAINKAPNTFRIFVLGESTTIGYPYFHNGSFHRWLQYRLMHEYPDVNFEIVNLSLTAVNSYTVLDFGRQLPKYQPDAVLIYTGHNEYYGALGVGSTSYIGSNRFLVQTLLKLRDLKLVQLLDNGIKRLEGVFSSTRIDSRETLMKRMAARQHIMLNSTDYQAGNNQYNQNMTELCSLLNDDKIPTFLSTLVSNEKDLQPFISNGTGPNSAIYMYKAGQQAMAQANFITAKADFVKAKERDELRFRAPEAINAIIRQLSAKFPFVHLVDTKKEFEQYSPHGIIGNETILEHVHPNLFGYAIMSDAFYQAIQKQHLINGAPEREISFEQLQKEMPITLLDSLSGLYTIKLLKTGWPFNQPMPKDDKKWDNINEKLAIAVGSEQVKWYYAMVSLFEYDKKTGDQRNALKAAEAMLLEYPTEPYFFKNSAYFNTLLNNFDEAAFYSRKLYQLSPDDQLAQMIGRLYLQADEPSLALPWAKYLDLNPYQRLPVENIIWEIINDKQVLKGDSLNRQAIARIAANYKILGISEMENKYTYLSQ